VVAAAELRTWSAGSRSAGAADADPAAEAVLAEETGLAEDTGLTGEVALAEETVLEGVVATGVEAVRAASATVPLTGADPMPLPAAGAAVVTASTGS
jgi:hypothetical protein